MTQQDTMTDATMTEYVTAKIGHELFGIPISRVQNVFVVERLTRVPMAPAHVAGILNLRGRIVTAVDIRPKLGLSRRESAAQPMAIGIDYRGESYGLIIDEIGEVLKLPDSDRAPNPVNLDAGLARFAAGIYQLDSRLLVLLDVDRILQTDAELKVA